MPETTHYHEAMKLDYSTNIHQLECVCAGQGSEDAGKPAARPGVLRQGQVVQHPGSRLEPADPAAVHRPAGAAPHPPGNFPQLVSRLL